MKKIICMLLLLTLMLPTLGACSPPQKYSDSFFLMDTLITVTLHASSDTDAASIFSECERILSELEALWSRTDAESDTSRINEAMSGEISVDARTAQLMIRALDVATATDGAFDITVAPLILLWQSCESVGRLPTDAELVSALASVDHKAVSVRGQTVFKSSSNAKIDLGGIGKGAAISYLADYLAGCPIAGALISFGSNVATVGKKHDGSAFRVAVKNPIDGKDYAKVLELSEGEVLSVSGDYERFYTICGEKYHHIIDPATGYPAASGLCSVAVICEDGALADALSTALFVMGEEKAKAFHSLGIYEFEAIFIASDGSVSATDGIAY